MKKGFSLIELLAVIVILAILALIVSPIISGVISDAKKASAKRSAECYIKAVEYAQIQYQYKNKGSITQSIENLSISAQGIDNVTVTSIEFSTSGIVTNAIISIDGHTCNYFSGKVECSKDNTSSKPVVIINLNEALIESLKNDTSSGLTEDEYEEGRYYYRGESPKNKLILHESIGPTPYRIISFEADGTIKVVREDRINENGNAWDDGLNRPTTINSYCSLTSNYGYGCNAWANQSNTYRNGVLMDDYFSFRYYDNNASTEMTIQGRETDPKTTVIKDSSLNEYLNSIFLTTNLVTISNYIDKHMWDVGGVYAVSKNFKLEIKETKDNKWKGYIAIFSIIDYIYSSGNIAQCINSYSGYHVTNGTSYYPCTHNSDGLINNYLFKDYTQWVLTPVPTLTYGCRYVDVTGSIKTDPASYLHGARPSFYLKSTIKLTGEGIEGNEFKIAES